MIDEDDQAPERDELGRWVKGRSGNPAGPPPKHIKLTPRLRRIAGEIAADHPEFAKRAVEMGLDPSEVVIGEVVLYRHLLECADGKHPHLAELLNRLDGKVAERVQMEGGMQQLRVVLAEADAEEGRDD